MKKPEKQSKKIGRTSDPWFDVNVCEILIPLDEVNKMSYLFDFSVNNFINIQRKTKKYHQSNGNVTCDSVFNIEKNENEGEYENLHVILKIPTPREAHMFSIIY